MRESRTYGSVRGAPSNGRPYRDRAFARHDEGGIAPRQRVITSGSWYDMSQQGQDMDAMPAAGKTRGSGRWVNHFAAWYNKQRLQRSPPHQSSPPPRLRANRKPHLLLQRAQVQLHHIREPPLQCEVRHAPRELRRLIRIPPKLIVSSPARRLTATRSSASRNISPS